jgi:hypothetical protein
MFAVTNQRTHLLLVVIVVGRGQEVAKYHLRDPDALLLMYFDGDAATIVED